jgi:protein-S-isoprenylcysteine O-methyltransferase Ste14
MQIVGLSLVGVLVLAGLIFVPAGRLDWTAGWVCFVVLVVGFSLVTAGVARRTPSLIRRRMRAGAGTPLWDRVIVNIVKLLFMAILITGGLDAGRYRWTSLPLWLQGVGVMLMIAGLALMG